MRLPIADIDLLQTVEFGEEKTPKQSARSARKPFVYANKWPVVLLYLLLTEC